MHLKTVVLSLLATLSATPAVVDARIVGLIVPTSVKAGKTFQASLQTQSYVSEWADYYLIFGMQTFTPCGTCIGTEVASFDLRAQGHSITGGGAFNETLTAPMTKGSYTLTAAVTSVIGASQEATIGFFTTTVTVS